MTVEYTLRAWKGSEHENWFIYVYSGGNAGKDHLSPRGFSYSKIAETIFDDWRQKKTEDLPRLISQSSLEVKLVKDRSPERYICSLWRPLTFEELQQVGSELIKLFKNVA